MKDRLETIGYRTAETVAYGLAGGYVISVAGLTVVNGTLLMGEAALAYSSQPCSDYEYKSHTCPALPGEDILFNTTLAEVALLSPFIIYGALKGSQRLIQKARGTYELHRDVEESTRGYYGNEPKRIRDAILNGYACTGRKFPSGYHYFQYDSKKQETRYTKSTRLGKFLFDIGF